MLPDREAFRLSMSVQELDADDAKPGLFAEKLPKSVEISAHKLRIGIAQKEELPPGLFGASIDGGTKADILREMQNAHGEFRRERIEEVGFRGVVVDDAHFVGSRINVEGVQGNQPQADERRASVIDEDEGEMQRIHNGGRK